MNFAPVNGNLVPLYGHNTVAPRFVHNSEAELYLMYELAVEHWNLTHDMNDLIDDYDELKTKWYVCQLGVYNDLWCSDAFVGAHRQAAGTWGASHAAEEGRVETESRVGDLI